MDHHIAVLVLLVLLVRFLVFVCIRAASLLPAFDSSASLVISDEWSAPLLRWDLFHFLHIAEKGYVYEYEYAFLQGTPFMMHLGSRLLDIIGLGLSNESTSLLIGGAAIALAFNVASCITLYDLTLHYFPRSPAFAYLTVLLSLLPSGPATLHYAPYSEPFFTCLSYFGMLFCARKKFIQGAISFALASFFRSNGTTLAGFVIWGIVVESSLSARKSIFSTKLLKRLSYGALLTGIVVAPFSWQQYNAYISFCTDPILVRRPWCTARFPLVYTFVQSEYWNVGLFRYWTLQQLPNILLAVPVLLLLFSASVRNIQRTLPQLFSVLINGQSNETHDEVSSKAETADPILSPSLTPHAIHALIMSITLLCAAHTQIALRQVSAMPFTYWAAASLFTPGGTNGHRKSHELTSDAKRDDSSRYRQAFLWTSWSFVWGAISLVTWSVFLPPA